MAGGSCAGALTAFTAARGAEGLPGPGTEARFGGRVLPEPSAWSSHGFACSLCKRLFSSLEHLREHEYRHTLSLMTLTLDWPSQPPPLHLPPSLYRPALAEPAQARYLCSQCPASFTLKSNADRHEKTIHFKKKLMQCVYCLKQFRDRTDLQRHLSSVHSKERGHACPACAKSFSTHKNLATHVKVCCQVIGVGSAPGAMLGGPAGAEMSPGGLAAPLWRLSQEMKVENHNRSINVEN